MGRKQKSEYACVQSAALFGIQGVIIDVECQQSLQVPTFSIVGLPVKAARDAKERVIAALFSSGLSFPSRRIVMNVTPAEFVGENERSLDLPIAIACLVAAGIVPSATVKEAIFLGELTLRGEIKCSQSALALNSLFRKKLFERAYISAGNLDVFPEKASGGGFYRLTDLVDALRRGINGVLPIPTEAPRTDSLIQGEYWNSIQGNAGVKKLLMTAAAGEHHSLFMGPKGVGKTMMARALPSILPCPLSAEAELSDSIYAIRGLAKPSQRPFRSPHPSLTTLSLLGGGINCLPGEVSLAHSGVLF